MYLYAEYPDCNGEEVYDADVISGYGNFEDDDERLLHLNNSANALLLKINEHT